MQAFEPTVLKEGEYLQMVTPCYLVKAEALDLMRSLQKIKEQMKSSFEQSSVHLCFDKVLGELQEAFQMGVYEGLGIGNMLTPVKSGSAKGKLQGFGKTDSCTALVSGRLEKTYEPQWFEHCEAYVFVQPLEVGAHNIQSVRAFLSISEAGNLDLEPGTYVRMLLMGNNAQNEQVVKRVSRKHKVVPFKVYEKKQRRTWWLSGGGNGVSGLKKEDCLTQLSPLQLQGFDILCAPSSVFVQAPCCFDVYRAQVGALSISPKGFELYCQRKEVLQKWYQKSKQDQWDLLEVYYQSFNDSPHLALALLKERSSVNAGVVSSEREPIALRDFADGGMVGGVPRELVKYLRRTALVRLRSTLAQLMQSPVSSQSMQQWFSAGVHYACSVASEELFA